MSKVQSLAPAPKAQAALSADAAVALRARRAGSLKAIELMYGYYDAE